MSLKVQIMLLVLMSTVVFISGTSDDTEADTFISSILDDTEAQAGEDVDADGVVRGSLDFWIECLHGDNKVQTTSGNKLVKELNIGDQVTTVDSSGKPKYEPVTLDLHKNEKVTAPFYEIRTKNRELKITSQHFIYTGKSINEAKLVASEQVTIGDQVLVYEGGDVHVEKVTAVSRFTDVGIYNPVVASGRMFVGGILTSNYVDLAPFTATHQHYSVWFIRQIDNIIPGFMSYNDKLLETNINYIIENIVLKAYSKLF